jgi:hypothetical protein
VFTHPYAAEMLAAQRIRELRADAARARLAKQLRTAKPAQRQRTLLRRAHHRSNVWMPKPHRRGTASKAT